MGLFIREKLTELGLGMSSLIEHLLRLLFHVLYLAHHWKFRVFDLLRLVLKVNIHGLMWWHISFALDYIEYLSASALLVNVFCKCSRLRLLRLLNIALSNFGSRLLLIRL